MEFKATLQSMSAVSKVRFKALMATAAILLIAGSITAASQEAEKLQNLTPLKIQSYPGLIDAGQPVIWVVVDKGFCKARGLDCQLVDIASGPLGLQALAAGSIQIALATTDTAMQAAAHGNDIQLIASIHPNRYFTLSVRKGIPLPNLNKGYPAVMTDLKGLKVGVTGRGSGTEIQTRALLIGAGMEPDDVTYVAVGSTGTSYPAMLAKQVDVVMGFEPFPTLCEVQDACVNVVSSEDGPADLRALDGAVEELSASRGFIAANPETIDAFILAIQDSVEWASKPENFDELLAITKKHFSLGGVGNSEDALKLILQKQQKQFGATLDRKAVQAYADFLLKYKLIDQPFEVNGFVYDGAPAP